MKAHKENTTIEDIAELLRDHYSLSNSLKLSEDAAQCLCSLIAKVAARYCRSGDVADVVQETILKIWLPLGGWISKEGHYRAALKIWGTARNQVRKVRRTRAYYEVWSEYKDAEAAV